MSFLKYSRFYEYNPMHFTEASVLMSETANHNFSTFILEVQKKYPSLKITPVLMVYKETDCYLFPLFELEIAEAVDILSAQTDKLYEKVRLELTPSCTGKAPYADKPLDVDVEKILQYWL
ncbi:MULTISPECIES: hypothetical protein [Flavobacterium]|uniref:hypothetical protein n=1 Tax=Flavobacterium TaxID=237 RepID=UPI000D49E3B6|nr:MULTISPECIES: hypothetical protein [Flavobacterium]POR20617.1 hypothetical protein BWK57_12945 [Flavobacterium columnare]